MTHEERAKDLIRRGSRFSFEHNSYNGGNVVLSRPGIDMMVWLNEVEDFITYTYQVGSVPYSQFSAFDRDHLKDKERDAFENTMISLISILETTLFIKPKTEKPKTYEESLKLLNNLFEKFHLVVGQLHHKNKHNRLPQAQRGYNVDEIFHALLKLYFDDIFTEERPEKHSDSESRTDFLLTDEEIILVLKEITEDFNENRFIEEIAGDIVRYKSHAGCNYMICFVFDPDRQIDSPERLIEGLTSETEGLKVEIIVK